MSWWVLCSTHFLAYDITGFACIAAPSSCFYYVEDQDKMQKQSRENHGNVYFVNIKYQISQVQALFASLGRVYFEIDPIKYQCKTLPAPKLFTHHS